MNRLGKFAIACALAALPDTIPAQLVMPTGDRSRTPSGPAVLSFKINGGVTTVSDRDITWNAVTAEPGLFYRVGEGQIPATTDWKMASSTQFSGELRLSPGPSDSRTVTLEIRKDGASTPGVHSIVLTLKYPVKNVSIDPSLAAFLPAARKISSTGEACVDLHNGFAAFGAQRHDVDRLLGIVTGISWPTICEIKVNQTIILKPGWTLVSLDFSLDSGHKPLQGSRCELKAEPGTRNIAMTWTITHPGSANPFDEIGTYCRLKSFIIRGPVDPDEKFYFQFVTVYTG